MQFAIIAPIFGEYADSRVLAGLARDAETAGWDGFFIWDHIATARSPFTMDLNVEPMVDPWIALSAIALNTTRLRIGPMVTPLPRRRPWKLARETVTLDHLSGGRLTLGVGSGFPGLIDEDFVAFGEAGEVKRRAALLDEGLDVLAGLWSGKPFSYQGQHYRVAETTFLPGPLQQPRIPVWVPGFWPALGPYRRAARWDGIWPLDPTGQMDPADLIRQAVARVKSLRASPAPFDVIAAGVTPGDDAAAARGVVEPQAAAGATWWCEFLMPARGDLAANRRRIQQGPPGSSRR